MKHSLVEARKARMSVKAVTVFALLAVTATACGDGGSESSTTDAGGGQNGADGGSGGANTPADGIDEAVLAKCPQSSSLIETTDWTSCLAGKRLTGTEPFTDMPCELRIGEEGVFEYLRGDAVAIAVPEKSTWRGANGTYQNNATSGPRFFLAGLSLDLPVVEGEPRVTNLNISLFALASQQDKVEIRYLDAALANQTYNCTVDAL
jgi:hypothetical protein